MSNTARKRKYLARLEELTGLKANVERARLARALRNEAQIAQDVASLQEKRANAIQRLAVQTAPEMTTIAATSAWLRASEEDLRRLNIQFAALRARSETLRADATRSIARHAVAEKLMERHRTRRTH